MVDKQKNVADPKNLTVMLRIPFGIIIEITYWNHNTMTEHCVVGLIRVSEQKHEYTMPKRNIKICTARPITSKSTVSCQLYLSQCQ
jgi:hypothetical protein